MNNNTCNAFSEVLAGSKCSINIIVVTIIITIIINSPVLVLAWSDVSYLLSLSLFHPSVAFASLFTALFPSTVLSFFPPVWYWMHCFVPVENSRGHCRPPPFLCVGHMWVSGSQWERGPWEKDRAHGMGRGVRPLLIPPPFTAMPTGFDVVKIAEEFH